MKKLKSFAFICLLHVVSCFFIITDTALYAQTGRETVVTLLNKLGKGGLSDMEQISLLLDISSIYQGIDIDSAKQYGNRAINLSYSSKHESLLAKCYLIQGTNYTWSWNMEAADSYLKKGESFAIRYNDIETLTGIYYVMSSMYQLNQVWDNAWIYARKISDLSQKIQADTLGLEAFAYLSFANVYTGVKDYKKADEYFLKANELLSSAGNTYQKNITLLEHAKMLIAYGRYDTAITLLDSAGHFFSVIDEPNQVADVMEYYGRYYHAMSKPDSALHYYSNAEKIYTNNSLIQDLKRLNLRIAHTLFDQNKITEAKNFALEAYYFFKSNKNNFLLLECLELLHKIEVKENVSRTNAIYFSEYITINNLVSDQSRLIRTRELITQYELEQKEKENQQLKIRYAYQQDRFWLITVSGILVLLTGIVLFVLYRKNRVAYRQVAHLQEITEERNKTLTQTIAVKEKLMSMLAHDVRSPVTSLENMLILSKDHLITTDEFEQLSDILLVETTHLKGMLDNMLLWANQQTATIKIHKKAIAIYPLIQNIIDMYKPGIVLKKLNLEHNVAKNAIIHTDPDVFHIIFRNILSNAIKFTPTQKNVFISGIQSGSKLVLSVQDEGIGMDETTLKKITDGEFFTTRGTENEKGSGLGISFVRELVKKIDETLEIHSKPGKGTTISISFTLG